MKATATKETKVTAIKMPKLITDSKAFIAACASIAKRGKLLDNDIQTAALSAINHAELHGDIGFVNRLYLSMPAGSRKAALTEWLVHHGKVQANAGENKKEMPFLFDKQRTTDMAGGLANPWFTFKLDKAPDEVFDIVGAMHQLLKRAQGKNVDALALAKVENLVSELDQYTLKLEKAHKEPVMIVAHSADNK